MVILIRFVPVALAILAASILNFHEVLSSQPEQDFSYPGDLSGNLTSVYGSTAEAGAFLYSVYDCNVLFSIAGRGSHNPLSYSYIPIFIEQKQVRILSSTM